MKKANTFGSWTAAMTIFPARRRNSIEGPAAMASRAVRRPWFTVGLIVLGALAVIPGAHAKEKYFLALTVAVHSDGMDAQADFQSTDFGTIPYACHAYER